MLLTRARGVCAGPPAMALASMKLKDLTFGKLAQVCAMRAPTPTALRRSVALRAGARAAGWRDRELGTEAVPAGFCSARLRVPLPAASLDSPTTFGR